MMRRQRTGYGRWGVGYIVQRGAALVCLLGLGDVVMGQGSATWDPVKTVCNMNAARGVVLGDKMFVDGGEIMDQQNYLFGIDKPYYNSNMFRWQNQHLWELDLSSKFNVSIPSWTAHPKPDDWNQHYNGASGALWNIGDGKFYTLGGWMSLVYEGPPTGHRIRDPYYTQNSSGFYYHLPDPRVFAYDPKTGDWSSQLQKDIHRLSDTGYAQSERNKVGYTVGGLRVTEEDSSNTDFIPLNVGAWVSTMSAYDFRTGKFNISDMPDDIGFTRQLVMHSLDRVGNAGVLVAFAGKSNNNNLEEYRATDEILVYDIETLTWMKQKATGDIPPRRQNTCSILVPAPDLSSYQIYIFSGISDGDVRILDMYVLSIPAFTWTKIDLKNYPEQYGIADMACGLYEGRQFIIVPGEANVTVSNQTTTQGTIDKYWLECNKGTAVHVFDTYDWEFKPEFDPDNKGSQVPPPIVKLVGGNSTGGATLQKPKAGWDTPALGPIFLTRNELPPDLPTTSPGLNFTSSPNLPSGSTSGAAQDTAKSNKGAIIGGVIGGICVVALVVGALIFFLKKRQKPSQDQSRVELQGTDLRAELQGIPSYHHPGPYNSPHELHAQEPHEMSAAAGGNYIPVKPEGQEGTVLIDHISPPPH